MEDNYINKIFNMTTLNFKTFIKFEIIYKLIMTIIFIPIAYSSLNLTLNILGITIINQENITQILTNPLMIIYLLLWIIFFIVSTLFEIVSLTVLFDNSYHSKKNSLKEIVKIAIIKTKEILRFKNFSLFLYLSLMMPFLNISVISSVIAVINIPQVIVDFFINNINVFLIIIGIYLLIIALLSDWLFTLHYMIIEDKDIKKAKEKSKKLIEKSTIKDYIKLFVSQLVFSATIIGTIVIFLIVSSFIYESFKINIKIDKIFTIIFFAFVILFFAICATMSNGISFSIISSLYYKHKKEKKEKTKVIKYDSEISFLIIKRLTRCALGILLIYVGVLNFFDFNTLKIEKKEIVKPKIEKKVDITAHRGASILYPENTLAAFRGAKELGAGWIELDVRQTKDGQLIILHDPNTERVTGYYGNVSEMSLSEIKELDFSLIYGEEYKNEKIPTLEESIIYAKENGLKINIELKVEGTEINFENQTVDLIEKYNFEDQCVVQSWSYDSLNKVKELNHRIKTSYLYDLPLENVDFEYLKNIDILSVEASFVNEEYIKKIHDNGKEIYVWTIDSEDKIKEMIDLNADNIITNDIILGKLLAAEKEMGKVVITPEKKED